MDGELLIKKYEKERVSKVKIAFTDVDGVQRGKYLSMEKFREVVTGSSGFCDCVFGWDVDDQLYDNSSFTGWHTAFPDAMYRVDLGTERRLKDEGNVPFFIADFIDDDANEHSICPRSRLKNIIRRSEEAGFSLKCGFEYEFFVFKETSQSIREKRYTNLEPLSPGNFGYSLLRTMTYSDLFNEFMDYCQDHKFGLEGLHCETGPGVWEAAISADTILEAADKAALFKTFTKAFFQRKNMTATFMAKWSMDYPGQSGHLHQSLLSAESGQNLFFDDKADQNISPLMLNYLGGLLNYMGEYLAMTSPTINSYTRLVKGAWAPTVSAWGLENRTTSLRVLGSSKKSKRIEFRLGSADANPYLVAAANIAAGLEGIESGLLPGQPITGNAYEQEEDLPRSQQLSSNLRDAVTIFRHSDFSRKYFGDEFVDHYSASREWEVREYERHVNDWQLKRYFEII